MLTNHHVAFGVIQYNSKPGQRPDRRTASSPPTAPANCPPTPITACWSPPASTSITDRILAGARGKQGRAYFDAVDAATKAAVAECEREAGMRCSVANMYYGTDFYLIRQLELRDIRLVYAPPRRDRQLRRRDRQLHVAAPHRRLHAAARLRRQGRQAGRLLAGQRAVRAAGAPAGLHAPREGRRLRDARRLPGRDVPPPHGVGIREPGRMAAAVARGAVRRHRSKTIEAAASARCRREGRRTPRRCRA